MEMEMNSKNNRLVFVHVSTVDTRLSTFNIRLRS